MPRKSKAAQEAAQDSRSAQEQAAQDVQEAEKKRGRKAQECKETCTDDAELVPIRAGKVDLTTPKQGLRGYGMAKQIREYFGEAGAKMAAQKLMELMNSPDERVALQAATMVIERVYGKARQEIDINADNVVRVVMGNHDPTDYSV